MRSAGFTLVELLIAFTLMSLIVLLLFSGLRLASRAWEGVDNSAERLASIRTARDLVAQMLIQARDYRIEIEDEAGSQLVFTGDTQSIEFVSPLTRHVGIPGLYILRLGLESNGGESQLVMTRWLVHPSVLAGLDGNPEWQPLEPGETLLTGPMDEDIAAGAFGSSLLLERIEEFEITYFGPPEGETGVEGLEDEGEWQEEWVERSQMPVAVRLHITTEAQDWPDTIVRLADGGA